jgi:hypothetical protein
MSRIQKPTDNMNRNNSQLSLHGQEQYPRSPQPYSDTGEKAIPGYSFGAKSTRGTQNNS